jgi:hypothetical protein
LHLTGSAGSDERLGTSLLLEFLMGSTIAEAAHKLGLRSNAEAEDVLRTILLRNGYEVRSEP